MMMLGVELAGPLALLSVPKSDDDTKPDPGKGGGALDSFVLAGLGEGTVEGVPVDVAFLAGGGGLAMGGGGGALHTSLLSMSMAVVKEGAGCEIGATVLCKGSSVAVAWA